MTEAISNLKINTFIGIILPY